MIYLVAFVAMFAQDIVLTLQTQAVNRGHPQIGGLLDCIGYFTQFTTYSLSVVSFGKHGLDHQTLFILASQTMANYVGTVAGVVLGDRWMHVDNLAPVKGLLSKGTADG